MSSSFVNHKFCGWEICVSQEICLRCVSSDLPLDPKVTPVDSIPRGIIFSGSEYFSQMWRMFLTCLHYDLIKDVFLCTVFKSIGMLNITTIISWGFRSALIAGCQKSFQFTQEFPKHIDGSSCHRPTSYEGSRYTLLYHLLWCSMKSCVIGNPFPFSTSKNSERISWYRISKFIPLLAFDSELMLHSSPIDIWRLLFIGPQHDFDQNYALDDCLMLENQSIRLVVRLIFIVSCVHHLIEYQNQDTIKIEENIALNWNRLRSVTYIRKFF